MKKTVLYVCIIFSSNTFAQYKGGNNDGFSKINIISQNALPSIYKGGVNDGFNSFAAVNQNLLPSIYKGGIEDGFSKTVSLNQNSLPNIYAGGNNDGFSKVNITAQNSLPEIYKGGVNDGFVKANASNQNLLPGIYTGGSNDGFSSNKSFGQNPFCTGDNVRWNGSISTAWDNPLNWDCAVMPNINSIVTIPSGLINYPIVTFSYEIRTLFLQTGASINIQPTVHFKLNGF